MGEHEHLLLEYKTKHSGSQHTAVFTIENVRVVDEDEHYHRTNDETIRRTTVNTSDDSVQVVEDNHKHQLEVVLEILHAVFC